MKGCVTYVCFALDMKDSCVCTTIHAAGWDRASLGGFFHHDGRHLPPPRQIDVVTAYIGPGEPSGMHTLQHMRGAAGSTQPLKTMQQHCCRGSMPLWQHVPAGFDASTAATTYAKKARKVSLAKMNEQSLCHGDPHNILCIT